MQIHDKTHLSIRAYMKQSGWQNARLTACPINPGGDCRLHRHGTYARKYPDGMRGARSYCRSCRKTFSLLPTRETPSSRGFGLVRFGWCGNKCRWNVFHLHRPNRVVCRGRRRKGIKPIYGTTNDREREKIVASRKSVKKLELNYCEKQHLSQTLYFFYCPILFCGLKSVIGIDDQTVNMKLKKIQGLLMTT